MGKWFSRNFRTIIYIAFLVPIITVAIVSISHVTVWYGISNPLSWAVYLSIGIEIAALSALAAISAQMGSKVYFPFGIVTLVQFVGNIFFAFEYIKIDSQQFLSWVELTGPILEYTGIELGDLQSHRRFLAIFAGGMLPLISLSFLHMLVKFNESTPKEISSKEPINNDIVEKDDIVEEPIQASDLVAEVSRFRPSEEDLQNLEDLLNKFKPEEQKKRPTKEEQREILNQIIRDDEEMGLYDEPFHNPLIKEETPEPPSWMDEIPEPTEDDYRDWDVTLTDGLDQDITWDEDHALDMVMNDMVSDLSEEEIRKIEVVLDELPTPTNNFDVNVVVSELPDEVVDEIIESEEFEVEDDYEIVIPKKVPNKYEQIEEYLKYTRGYDDIEENIGDAQLPDKIESAELDLDSGKIILPTPQPTPNFNFRTPLPLQDQEDPEKKN